MANDTLTLALQPRDPAGSRTARRLRSTGEIPGVLYGLDSDPTPIAVKPADLRLVLLSGHALFEVELEGSKQPVLLKQADRHPVRGNVTHVDLLRVDLTKPVESIVPIELTGVENAPGVIARGVLDHQLREIAVLALPSAIPDVLLVDVSSMDLGDIIQLDQVETPEGVEIIADHADEIAVVTLTAPRRAAVSDDEAEGEEAAAEGEDASAEGADSAE